MPIFKIILKNLLIAIYGFISGLYLPSILSVAFNYTHGPVNNPDGEIFIPVGILILLTILVIDVLVIIRTIKSEKMTKHEKIITILVFISAKFIGLTQDQEGWRNFIYSLKTDNIL